LIIAAVLACGVPSSVSASSSPAQLLNSILAAANARHSVHDVSTGDYGAVQLTEVDDAGVTEGIQRITLVESGHTGHVTVIATKSAAYVRGDAFTLANYIGAKASAAAKYAGRWIKFTPKDAGFKNTVAGVTLASAISQLVPAAPLRTIRHVTIGGVPVFGVRGVTPSSQPPPAADTLYARAVGAPLPVKQVVKLGTQRLTVTLSRWNEPIRLHIPRKTVRASIVLAGP
jgi:hypothetical protein